MLSDGQVEDAYELHFNFGLGRMLHGARSPIEASAFGGRIQDRTGREFLDFATSFGVFNLGHRHPAVAAAVNAQLAALSAPPSGLQSRPEIALRRRLADLLPGDLTGLFFAGSGSEATELALRMALSAGTGRTRIISTDKAYHGKTLGALALIGQPHLRAPFAPLRPQTTFVAAGDAAAMVGAIDEHTLAVFVEPVTAGNFLVVPPPGYLAAIREACTHAGALMVVDEVQTGFGRTGWLFGVDRDEVVPDMMLLSKGLTGGHAPLAAVAYRPPVARALQRAAPEIWSDLECRDTPSPVACAAALAALTATLEGDLVDRVNGRGARLLSGLKALAAAFPSLVLKADGLGLMTGLVLRNRAVEFALYLKMLRRGVLTGLSLNSTVATPVVRLYPPLGVKEGEIDEVLEKLAAALQEIDRVPRPLLDLLHHGTRNTSYFPKTLARFAGDLLG